MLAEIEVTEPFAVNGAIVAKLTVSPITFVDVSECAKAAKRFGVTVSNNAAIMRARRQRQVKALSKDGKEIVLDDVAFGQMPRRLFIECSQAIASQDESPGKIIADGDGIGTPIIFALAKPLTFKGGEGSGEIKELEFRAQTGAEIENVLCADTPVDQTIALLSDCATPLGRDVTLQRLPSWMIEQVSLGDGIAIMDGVLPRFFE